MVTLDSCRWDTFAGASLTALHHVGPAHKAHSPSYYTYGSHSAMFTGFTPGVASLRQPLLNPKFGKLFRLDGGGSIPPGGAAFSLRGPNIVEGFRRLGHHTLGTGAVGWFDTDVETGHHLTQSFDEFWYTGSTSSVEQQVAWVMARLPAQGPVFAFLNVGETHVPYYFQGADWSADDNPCAPFQTVDRSAECRQRQRLALEHVDAALSDLIDHFLGATILVCADHGDCWGEDGLWEHGVSHEKTLAVPLLLRVRGEAITGDPT